MEMEQIIEEVRGRDGALVVVPEPGGPFPELAWGDAFFYYAPDGRMPEREQPYATIVTKDYPGDTASGLNEPGRWRVNVHVGRAKFEALIGAPPRAFAAEGSAAANTDASAVDEVLPHPVYAAQGWVAVVNPATRTADLLSGLLAEAHEAARARAARRPRRDEG
ncbi:DUF6194 family protein [Agromyces sp. G08B096]|uniref:DUF6194 family protein n=1 Tax=Agromyces sp. G08B096 TaxID=3156399 RepID=A0AAU7W4V6_9MICO